VLSAAFNRRKREDKVREEKQTAALSFPPLDWESKKKEKSRKIATPFLLIFSRATGAVSSGRGGGREKEGAVTGEPQWVAGGFLYLHLVHRRIKGKGCSGEEGGRGRLRSGYLNGRG